LLAKNVTLITIKIYEIIHIGDFYIDQAYLQLVNTEKLRYPNTERISVVLCCISDL